MPRFAPPRGFERLKPGPVSRLVLLVRKPAAYGDQGIGNVGVSAADRVAFNQRRRCLPEGAGMDLLRDQLDPTLFVELDSDGDVAAAGWGAELGLAVLPLERARIA